MKIAVVYYSMSENTAYAAEKIAARLGADCIRLTPVKAIPDKGFRKFLWGGKSALMGEKPELEPYTFDAAQYDAVIFGTPVWASSPAPPLRSFIAQQLPALSGKRFFAYACLMGSGAEKTFRKLAELLSVESLSATLALISPKDAPSSENEEKIEAFCRQIESIA